MRRNLYNKNRDTFKTALINLGWGHVPPGNVKALRGYEEHFRKRNMHLILKANKKGDYCVMHIDRYMWGKEIHTKPITKAGALVNAFKAIVAEYKLLRS